MATFHFQRIERQGELPLLRLQSDDPSVYINVIANNRAGFIEFLLVWGPRHIFFTATEAVEGRSPSKKRDVFWTILDVGIFGRGGVQPYFFQSKDELVQALDYIRAALGSYTLMPADLGLEVNVRSVTLAPRLKNYVKGYPANGGGNK